MKNKYRVQRRRAAEFGSKSKIYVIQKLIWGLFYWDTDGYYFNKNNADAACANLNEKTNKQ